VEELPLANQVASGSIVVISLVANRALELLALWWALLLMYFPEPADRKAVWSVDFNRAR